MIKVSDYIFQYLVEQGLDTVFLVTGGGAMHLNDSIGKTKGLRYICNHNEQASAIAAEGYARVNNKPAIVNVTAGPGGINALNGVFGAFTDSIPMIIISGQAKRQTMLSTYNIEGLRQLGDQEVDIVSMVKKITKYAVVVTNPEDIKYHIEKAFYLATSGRPGPVWIDVPVDVQGSMINEKELKGFEFPKVADYEEKITDKVIEDFVEKIAKAQRPIIVASTGIRLGNAINELYEFSELTGVPVTTAWCHDIFDYYHPHYVGKQGTIGDRAGNFAVQNSDLVMMLASRMPIRQVSYNWENFARHAYKIQVDIDAVEMQKPTIKIDWPIHSDIKYFLTKVNTYLRNKKLEFNFKPWLNWCIERKNKFPTLLEHHKKSDEFINPYYFLSKMHDLLNENDIIACGDATACIVTFQTSKIKKGQLMFSNSGCASMGFDLPSAIGAAAAQPNKRIICVAGDGSIQMNLQELQTIVHENFNIKIIVLDNDGYLSIKSTQNAFFGQSVGSNPKSGVSFPNMERVAKAYGIKSITLDNQENFEEKLNEYLNIDGPTLINVRLNTKQGFEPKLSSKKLEDGTMVSAPLEDMFPFLSNEELKANMIVPTLNFGA